MKKNLDINKLIKNLDKIESPVPLLKVPNYKEGRYGDWTLGRAKEKVSYQGYWSGVKEHPDLWYLTDKEGTVWMSLTAMELESQAIPALEASGHVVIAGMGMGVLLFNICQKPEVRKVTVVERDPNIVRLLKECSDCELWQGWHKVNIIVQDALTFKPQSHVDYLIADIWQSLGGDEALTDTQQMQQNIKASKVAFWGQEQLFMSWWMKKVKAMKRQPSEPKLEPTMLDWKEFVKFSKLPLKGCSIQGYPQWCRISLVQQARTSNII